MRDGINITKYNRPIGKEPERPFGISLRRSAASKGNNMSLYFSGYFSRNRWSDTLLALHGSLKTFFSVAGPDRLNGGCGSIECQSSFLDCHRLFPITVNRKKNVCSEDRSSRHFSGTYHLDEPLALFRRQTHLVLFYRNNRNLLCIATQSCE